MSLVRNAGSLQIAVAPEAVKTYGRDALLRVRDGEPNTDAEHRVPTGPRQASSVAACPCLVSATITLLLLLLVVQASSGQVPYERIRRAESEPGNWLTYSGNHQSHRHSLLTQINPRNIARLKPAWVYQIRNAGEVETSPIVLDGVLYITEKPNVVTALDGKTGRPLWSYRRALPTGIPACCGPVNRGVAILDDLLFLGTYDAHLVALDLRTGKERWDVIVGDYKVSHTITVAPLAVKDKVIVGIAGGDWGIRGFLDAYDAKTGERSWRLWTVPGPGEPGSETWAGDSWKTGGATTWVTGSYDPELNLIYWGTGNPGPDYNGDVRAGDNLYSASLLAIDADSGKLRWHFQFTPHDVHDWDSNQVPVLMDGVVNGRRRKLVLQANRNAFYYVLDRTTGEFLSGKPYVKQTWASGLDARGRPLVLPNTDPTPEGTLVYPGLGGGTNWYSPSYSPSTGLFYVPAQEDYGQFYYKLKAEYVPGSIFESGGTRDLAGVEHYGAIKALEAETGKLCWEFRLHTPSSAGVLSTAGGLVFTGTREGWFFALDAASGKPLWHFQTGGEIGASPVSFLVDQKQHIAIAAGQALFVFALE
jgi:alcohol dehydrogenase (cytochrome c)